MKVRIFILIFVLNAVFLAAKNNTNVYLSFEFAKGQEGTSLYDGTFSNSALGLMFTGNIKEQKVGYNAEVKINGNAGVEVIQALASFNIQNYANIKAGLFLVPFGGYNTSSRPFQTMLINRPLNVEHFYPSNWRDIGILFEGQYKSIFYSAYVGNGLREGENLNSGQQFRDNNKDKGKGGRIGLSLSEEFNIAYSHYRGKCDEENSRNIVLQGVDLMWSSEEYIVRGEYIQGQIENPDGYSKGEAKGYFIEVGIDLLGVRPVVSYQQYEYEDMFHGSGFQDEENPGSGISEEKSRWTIGLVYFLKQNVLIKLEYDLNKKDEESDPKNNVFLFQLALTF
ncbi:MAG: hypothetical protein ACOC5F_04010 [Candidatus Aminicenantaceae bacterium]